MRHRHLLLPVMVLVAAPLAAEPGLPDEAAVVAALSDHPSVVAARARVAAARAEARAGAIGPQEVTFSGSYTKRSIDMAGKFDEFDVSLTRPFRLPGKGRLDRQIGEFGVVEAENLAEDARHQAALVLMGHWFDWLGAAAEARVDEQAVTNYEAALASIQRRVELRDAAQLDADQSAAALAGARALAEQSSGRERVARGRLEAHYPGLALPAEASEIPPPRLPDGGLEPLRAQVLANSHEIAAADAFARRMASVADRAVRERTADPSLGLRLFSERGGEERGVGLVFSLPLGGGHRAALADRAAAQSSSAQAEAALVRYNAHEVANADFAEASYRYLGWQRAREGLEAQMAALARLRRGNQLGEIDLAALLLGERLVHDAYRAEAIARTEALRAITKLRIDSHELWLRD
ncbi:MAG: TolC family protein [Alphaproteobacteria bacterium]|nr:TolC family protein [Alphaproteobacteria bacterium]MBU0794760.1 TolC family protein [Alphaproteobacteria bacterium]MBU0874339.1 TolC family protein [Alphaproteobacteria bacterium]MBU1769671.1 TolC family protein [Alphaproteobacteria bacterium]